MVGTNITALDNFFLYIEKNIFFSTIVLQSQRLVEKGAAQLIKKTYKTKPNITANKLNSRPSFQQLLLLSQTPTPPPTPPPSNQEAVTQLKI